MTSYTRSKINEISDIIKQISNRQKEIRKEIMKANTKKNRDILDNERTANTAAIRICHWIKWTLKGLPFNIKFAKDRNFIQWMHEIKGYYIQDFLAGVFDIQETEYKIQQPNYRWLAFDCYKYNSQLNIYCMILDLLFKKDGGGIFSFKSDDDIESDIWREYFNKLIQREWEEFKEMGLY